MEGQLNVQSRGCRCAALASARAVKALSWQLRFTMRPVLSLQCATNAGGRCLPATHAAGNQTFGSLQDNWGAAAAAGDDVAAEGSPSLVRLCCCLRLISPSRGPLARGCVTRTMHVKGEGGGTWQWSSTPTAACASRSQADLRLELGEPSHKHQSQGSVRGDADTVRGKSAMIGGKGGGGDECSVGRLDRAPPPPSPPPCRLVADVASASGQHCPQGCRAAAQL